ncbi:MAG: HAMP domain-containing protein [Deltaproteobacteria bacterium]|nr:HAMP domain-containing protein [Deltaproteobacteria bacterium]
MLLAFFFSRYLSKPLSDLRLAVEGIARGDFNITVTPVTKDEVGELSRSFNIMAEVLKREERLRRHLISNVVHELRTPLTIAKCNIEAIEDKVISAEEGLENIKCEIDHLVSLVKGIEDRQFAEASFLAGGND